MSRAFVYLLIDNGSDFFAWTFLLILNALFGGDFELKLVKLNENLD